MTASTSPNDPYQNANGPRADRLRRFRQQVTRHTLALNRKQRWSYLVAGQTNAPVLLVLPGGGGQAETLFRYIDLFATRYRVIAPDIPPTLRTMEQVIAGLTALLDAEQVESFDLFGASFGGALAQVLLRHLRERVRGAVILFSVIPAPHLAEAVNMQRAFIAFYPDWLMMFLARRRLWSELAASPANDAERAFWRAYFTELYAQGYRKRDLLARARIMADYHRNHAFKSDDLRDWPGPLLLIEAEADETISDGDRGALLAMYPRASVQTLTGQGHLALLLNADDLAQSALKFLTSMS